MEGKRECKGWERQIDKGKGREKSILRQEYAHRWIKLLEYHWFSLLTRKGISVV